MELFNTCPDVSELKELDITSDDPTRIDVGLKLGSTEGDETLLLADGKWVVRIFLLIAVKNDKLEKTPIEEGS